GGIAVQQHDRITRALVDVVHAPAVHARKARPIRPLRKDGFGQRQRRIHLQLITDWQRTNTNAGIVQHDNASLLQGLFDGGQIHQQQRELSCRPAWSASKKDKGWLRFSSQREQCSEICIRGYYDALLLLGAFKYRLIVCRLQTVGTYVHCIIAMLPQSLGNRGRECVINEEFHELTSGNSRSRKAAVAY